LDVAAKPKFKQAYDIIILDEAQDISELYYRLVLKIYNDNNENKNNENKNNENKNIRIHEKETKICIFGDKNQCIFQFNNADERYIIYANQIYNLNNHKWKMRNLSQSFRITSPMAEFINNCVLNEPRMKSFKRSHYKPRYVVCDCFGDNKIQNGSSVPFEILKDYLSKGYSPSDIFILAPSIRGNKNPIKKLENLIISGLNKIQVYIPTSDEEKLDDDVIKNKLVFSSFHQVKG
jgi:ATP-dependent exoDNAse (exonuclease V) beta subunit (contains helicase and exonuclease domains)